MGQLVGLLKPLALTCLAKGELIKGEREVLCVREVNVESLS